jgi:hypothetical protein
MDGTNLSPQSGSSSGGIGKNILIFLGIILVVLIPLVIFGVLLYRDANISVKDVNITNITDSGFTVTWVSDDPYVGRVVFQEDDKTWPAIFSQNGKEMAYDDRDVKLNENGTYVQQDSGVIPRYTHHVTVRNVSPRTTYSLRVAGTINGKEIPLKVTTKEIIEDLNTPDPAYGKIEGVQVNDSFIIISLAEPSEEYGLVSVPVSDNGTYSFDMNQIPEDKKADSLVALIKNENKKIKQHEYQKEDYKPLETIVVIEDTSTEADIKGVDYLVNEVAASGCASGEYYCGTFTIDGEQCSVDRCVKSSEFTEIGATGCYDFAAKTCSDETEELGPPTYNEDRGPVDDSSTGEASETSYSDVAPDFGKVESEEPLTTSIGKCNDVGWTEGCTFSGISCGKGLYWTGSSGHCYFCVNNGEGMVLATKGNFSTCPPTYSPGETEIPSNLNYDSIDEFSQSIGPDGVKYETSGKTPEDVQEERMLEERIEQMKNDDDGSISYDGDSSSVETVVGDRRSCQNLGGFINLSNEIINKNKYTEGVSYDYCLLDNARRQYYALDPYTITPQNKLTRKPVDVGVKLEQLTEDDLQVDLDTDACSFWDKEGDAFGLAPGASEIGTKKCTLGSGKEAYYCLPGYTKKYPQHATLNACVRDEEKIDSCVSKGIDDSQTFKMISSNAVNTDASLYEQCTTFEGAVYYCENGAYMKGANREVNECIKPGRNLEPEALIGLIDNVHAQTPASRGAVLGDSNGESLTTEESGRYVFFQDGEKIAEQDIVVKDDEVEIKLYDDLNGNGLKDENEDYYEDYSQISIAKEASVESYVLSSGWNLIHIPMIDTRTEDAIESASDFVNYWKNQGANILHIARYKDGKFEMYTQRETDNEYDSSDFDIYPGEGIFVMNMGDTIELTFSGNKVEESFPLTLNNGWNLVGVIAPETDYNSEQVLEGIGEQGITADTISQFENGIYQSVIYEESTLFGNNFNVIEKRGYFIRVQDGGGSQFTP